ncbi:glycoside hydrolase family 13 protein [Fundicoccus culcitae]|uniref:glycoside hydrolase family 13 protein n=1 Tax=Fundicoccus culcitae TaxID=2969821 RepID=UPI0036F2A311
MDKAAIYHRPESEYAYMYDSKTVHIRIRTKKDNVEKVNILHGDPYLIYLPNQLMKSPLTKIASSRWHDYWQIELSGPHRRMSYIFELEAADEIIYYSDIGALSHEVSHLDIAYNYFKLPYLHEADRFKEPRWVKDTVWYHIFPERFANGDPSLTPEGALPWNSTIVPKNRDFFGGDLKGIYDHLDYLEDLGINGLYFCPIFEANSNHKYDTVDYYEIDKHFGDKEMFRKLVDEAHRRGMRVMLDAVFNHIGSHAPQWLDIVEKGEQSIYKDWFHIHSLPIKAVDMKDYRNYQAINYDAFGYVPNMPKWNTSHPEVKQHLLAIAKYWIEEFDIDAWRLDVANEVDHRFWRSFHDEVTALKPDFYIVGEIWHSSQAWLQGDQFHAVMNYPLTRAISDFFLTKTANATELNERIQEQTMLYRKQTNQVMLNSLDSHDTPRILTIAGGDKKAVKSALAFMYLQQGSPCLYYGTEMGLDGGNDPECRKVMPWDPEQQDLDMHAFVRQLIHLRREYAHHIVNGTTSYQVEGNLIMVEIVYDEKVIKGYFNQSEESVTVEKDGLEVLLELMVEDHEIQAGGLMIVNGSMVKI